MRDLNNVIQYNIILQAFWTNLDTYYASLTGTHLEMKYAAGIKFSRISKREIQDYLRDLHLVNSLLDIDIYWRFQKTSKQCIMISIPAETFYMFINQNKVRCFDDLKKRVIDFNQIFDYQCIDFVIAGNFHFS